MDTWVLATAAFVVTSLLVLWRPGGVHEAVPALIGAAIVFLTGLVGWADIERVAVIVTNAALVIVSTSVMASILDATGFFSWVARRMAERSGGSGHRLFHLVTAFSVCLTWFFNNDGSILIGTPIIAALMHRLGLSEKASLAYLISACLMASAASSPVAVSNMANLEAMAIAGVSLSEHFAYVFLPAILGMIVAWRMLYTVFTPILPADIRLDEDAFNERDPQTGEHQPGDARPHPVGRLMWLAAGVVLAVRFGIFAAPQYGIPLPVVPTVGALMLLIANWRVRAASTRRVLGQAPWLLFAFAFGMDLVVFGLRNAGLTGWAADQLHALVQDRPFAAAMGPLLATTVISALLNNHPAMIVGSIALSQLTAMPAHLYLVGYAGIIVGADLGALITPVGTLASLMWFHSLRQRGYRYTWTDYMRVTAAVIPGGLLAALIGLAIVLGVGR